MTDPSKFYPSMAANPAPQASAPAPVAAAPPAVPTPESPVEEVEHKASDVLFPSMPPDKYEFKAPEGYEHLVPDHEGQEIFSGMAKDMKLTNAQAQALLDLYVRRTFAPKA